MIRVGADSMDCKVSTNSVAQRIKVYKKTVPETRGDYAPPYPIYMYDPILHHCIELCVAPLDMSSST